VNLLQQMGVLEARYGCFEEAERLFGRANTLDQRNVMVLHAWGELHRKRGSSRFSFERAETLFRQALALDPQHRWSLISLAQLLESSSGSFNGSDKNRAGEARTLLQLAVQIDPSNTVARQALARLEWNAGNRREARRLYGGPRDINASVLGGSGSGGGEEEEEEEEEETGGSFHPEKTQREESSSPSAPVVSSPSLLTGWAQLEGVVANVTRSRRLYRRALSLDPDHLPAILGLAMLEARDGDIELARQLYQRGLELDPHNVRLLCAWAQFHLRQLGLSSEARAICTQLVQRHPHCCRAWYTLGVVHQHEGSTKDALEAFMQGAACAQRWQGLARGSREEKEEEEDASMGSPSGCSERDTEAALLNYQAWAEMESFQGRLRTGIKLLEEGYDAVMAVGGGGRMTTSYLRCWAQLLRKADDVSGALAKLKQAQLLDPGDHRSFVMAALFLRRLGRTDEARVAYRQAASVRPVEPVVWLSWAQLETGLGQDREATGRARSVLWKGLEHCPRVPQLWTELAMLELRSVGLPHYLATPGTPGSPSSRGSRGSRVDEEGGTATATATAAHVDRVRRMLALASYVQPSEVEWRLWASISRVPIAEPHLPALTTWIQLERTLGHDELASRLEGLVPQADSSAKAKSDAVQNLAKIAKTEVHGTLASLFPELRELYVGQRSNRGFREVVAKR